MHTGTIQKELTSMIYHMLYCAGNIKNFQRSGYLDPKPQFLDPDPQHWSNPDRYCGFCNA
jgi:hypothetical protein